MTAPPRPVTSTPIDIDEFVNRFGKHVDAGTATVFVGAGLSLAAGYPSWKALVDRYQKELGLAGMNDFPLLVQYFEDRTPNGRATVRADVESAIRSVVPSPTDSHRLLAKLPISEIWTTNYDPLLEMGIPGLDVIMEDVELAVTRPGGRRLCKMNGSVDMTRTSKELVLSRDQFERYPVTHPRFWRLLEASFLTRSFLFLGFALSDPNINQVFQLVRAFTPDITREHFTITVPPSDPAERRKYEFQRADFAGVGVRVIEVSDYGEINRILRRLVARCRPGRVFISGSYLGPRSPSGDSYPTAAAEPAADEFADTLGRLFADTSALLMAGGELGARVGYETCRRLLARNQYSADRFILLRRRSDKPLDPPNLRLGSVRFAGENADPLRTEALEQVRATVILGGGTGAANEAARSFGEGIGVIPVAHTGGTARQVWEDMNRNLHEHRLGERFIDPNEFALLASAEPEAAAAATVRLALQALFIG